MPVRSLQHPAFIISGNGLPGVVFVVLGYIGNYFGARMYVYEFCTDPKGLWL